jgi:hypothetical protein
LAAGVATVPAGRPLGREIGVDCMSQKDESGKQTEDYRESFNHLTHPGFYTEGTFGMPRLFQDRFISPR